ncbi:hypothetical protein Ciccas_004931 [Cichlidogyrus casuarinus]|uniref:Uncharacterized protein n=1 Tax=Cichlidogyrus casuarinus TaxID=1844966 RepID=A0ABD2QA68_9PLAT
MGFKDQVLPYLNVWLFVAFAFLVSLFITALVLIRERWDRIYCRGCCYGELFLPILLLLSDWFGCECCGGRALSAKYHTNKKYVLHT